MKVTKSTLQRIVKEETLKYVKGLYEDDKKKVVDASKDSKPKDGPKDGKEKKDDKPPAPKKEKEPKVQPQHDDPADPDLKKDVEEPGSEVTGGEIAQELTGKTIQSLTMNPKSKMMPGAQEIVLTFNEVTDPLKIFVTKTGAVKFFYKGLRNSL